MELRNITSYKNFRRTFEATVPDDFSNKTGFSESLVGRAMFGILRYFKKGVNLGKLEYYKRKLENEYFAGILRFCANMNIDLLTGGVSSGSTSDTDDGGGGPPQPSDEERTACDILNIDYSQSDYKSKLEKYINDLTNDTNALTQILPTLDQNTQADIISETQKGIDEAIKWKKCAEEKLKICDLFSSLTGVTDATILEPSLNVIKSFLESDESKMCSLYKGTDAEKTFLRDLETSITGNQPDIDKVKDILTNGIFPLLENYFYEYDLIREKITSGINKFVSISQILGDQLTLPDSTPMKVDVFKWLKDRGIEDASKINWVELEKTFSSNKGYKEGASSMVNKEGIRQIQYAVSRIIFHIKKTPDTLGINPGKGGSVEYDEDTSLRTSWEKKVEFVKSEFRNFLLVDQNLDPFVIQNITDRYRRRDSGDNFINSNEAITSSLATSMTIDSKSSILGLKPRGNENNISDFDRLYIFTMTIEGKTYYPVFQGRKENGKTMYKYIGNINLSKIMKDKVYEKSDFKNLARNYATGVWETPKSSSDTNFINFLKLQTTPPPKPSVDYYFHSISLYREGFNTIHSYKDSPISSNCRILYTYVKRGQSNGDFKEANSTANDFKINILKRNALMNVDINKINSDTLSKTVKIYLGETYEILQSFESDYFPVGLETIRNKVQWLNQDPFYRTIKFV